MSSEHLLDWKVHVSKYRKTMDMATLFWRWQQLDNSFDFEEKLQEIIKLFDFKTDATVIHPRNLWGELLGKCNLYYTLQQSGIKNVMPEMDGELHELHGMTYRIEDGQIKLYVDGVDPNRNKFNLTKFNLIYKKVISSESETTTYNLNWFIKYRQHMSKVTPFSDYALIMKDYFNKNDDDVRLMFFEECIVETFADSMRVGMYDPATDAMRFFDEVVSEYAVDDPEEEPLLYVTNLTHTFINFDSFIEACDRNNYPIPDGLRLPKQTVKGEEEYPKDIDSRDPLPQLVIDRMSSFPLMKVAPLVLDWINRDPEIIKILSDNKDKTKLSRVKSYISSSVALHDEELTILLTVLLPSGVNMRRGLFDAIDVVWSKNGIAAHWFGSDVSADRRAQLIKKVIDIKYGGCSIKESKKLLSLISPQNLKSWVKITDLNKWDEV